MRTNCTTLIISVLLSLPACRDLQCLAGERKIRATCYPDLPDVDAAATVGDAAAAAEQRDSNSAHEVSGPDASTPSRVMGAKLEDDEASVGRSSACAEAASSPVREADAGVASAPANEQARAVACAKCGNGIVEAGEACDTDTWHCSPDCKSRNIFTVCDLAASSTCGEATVACYENICTPQVANYDVASCPKLVGPYTLGITFGQGCVIACSAPADCPAHLPRCIDNPWASADPRETPRYCWRSY